MNIKENICTSFGFFLKKIARHYQILDMIGINQDLVDSNQKRVLIAYKSLVGHDIRNIQHAQDHHINQMLHYFITRNYCIDLCDCKDTTAFDRIKRIRYDIVLGFGPLYEKVCTELGIPLKVLFVTENNPSVVKNKYNERLEYFKERHPSLTTKKSLVRSGFYNANLFRLSDVSIIMNSQYNAESMIGMTKFSFRINSNAIQRSDFILDETRVLAEIERNRNNFVWFGSGGAIHKGLDLLLDAFHELPESLLSIYGLYDKERYYYDKLKSGNTIDRGRISVSSASFLENVVYGNTFVIYPSCSEGMNTGVATCMSYGLIPIVTKECGFDYTSGMIILDDFKIETIVNCIKDLDKMPSIELVQRRKQIYEYSQTAFSLRKFDNDFSCIMDKILEIHDK